VPLLTNRQSVAANATISNVFAGQLHEFLQTRALLRIYGTASAVGLNTSVIIGDEVIIDDQELSAQNRMPIIPDDFVAEGAGFKGDRVVVRLRNTTAGAITAFTRVDVVPR
jgi:hypothetical protein